MDVRVFLLLLLIPAVYGWVVRPAMRQNDQLMLFLALCAMALCARAAIYVAGIELPALTW